MLAIFIKEKIFIKEDNYMYIPIIKILYILKLIIELIILLLK